MNLIQNRPIAFVIIILLFARFASAQDSTDFEIRYEVNQVYQPLSITKGEVKDAQILLDLNKNYKESWVKKYKSVEISTWNNGKQRKSVSHNNVLNKTQKDNMETADYGSDISVVVRYLPDNTLTHNDIKEYSFTFTVEPEFNAKFLGGHKKLEQYIKEKVVAHISVSKLKKHNLAAVKFTVDEAGNVINAHIFQSSHDDQTDGLLMKAVCAMPPWSPAEYSNGQRVNQEYVLTAGDMNSCVVNLLHIDKDGPAILKHQ